MPAKSQCSGRWTVNAAGAVHELAVAAVIAAPQKADAGQRVLRPADQVMAPQRAEQFGWSSV